MTALDFDVPSPESIAHDDLRALRGQVGLALARDIAWRCADRRTRREAARFLLALETAVRHAGQDLDAWLLRGRRGWLEWRGGLVESADPALRELIEVLWPRIDSADPDPAILDGIARAAVDLASIHSGAWRSDADLEASPLGELHALLDRGQLPDSAAARISTTVRAGVARAQLEMRDLGAATKTLRELEGTPMSRAEQIEVGIVRADLSAAGGAAMDAAAFTGQTLAIAREGLAEEAELPEAVFYRRTLDWLGERQVAWLVDAGELGLADEVLVDAIGQADVPTVESLRAVARLLGAGVTASPALALPAVAEVVGRPARADRVWAEVSRRCMADGQRTEAAAALVAEGEAAGGRLAMDQARKALVSAADLAATAGSSATLCRAAVALSMVEWDDAGSVSAVAAPLLDARASRVSGPQERALLTNALAAVRAWEAGQAQPTELPVHFVEEDGPRGDHVAVAVPPGPAGTVQLSASDGLADGLTVVVDAASTAVIGWRAAAGSPTQPVLRQRVDAGRGGERPVPTSDPVVMALRQLGALRLAEEDRPGQEVSEALAAFRAVGRADALDVLATARLATAEAAAAALADAQALVASAGTTGGAAGRPTPDAPRAGLSDADLAAHDRFTELQRRCGELGLSLDGLDWALGDVERRAVEVDRELRDLAHRTTSDRVVHRSARRQSAPADLVAAPDDVDSRFDALEAARAAAAISVTTPQFARGPWAYAAALWKPHDADMAAICAHLSVQAEDRVIPPLVAGGRHVVSGVSADAPVAAVWILLLAAHAVTELNLLEHHRSRR